MHWIDDFRGKILNQEPMAMHTWFQLGGNAEYFAEPETPTELAAMVRRCEEENVPLRILGGGSNILVREAGVSGLVLHLSENLTPGPRVEENRIRVGGSIPLGHLVTSAVRAGLGGLEELIGIPGTVGGALRGNAGTNSVDMGQHLKSVLVMRGNGEISEKTAADLAFGYRQSSLDGSIILEAEFELREEPPVELARQMQKLWILRKSAQPMGHQCSGRIFRNPVESGSNASEIIEMAGLKGTRLGGAVVCERQANFIVTEPECTPSDILRLIDLIREQVFKRFGVELETEIEIW
ncbi:MAG: UDP-N-acetylmuramate dehydrogenase [Planctomycetia bacterium]|nr:UDP-N-acetylmuramate dehydrogenase [Planctomycetia bacterium]